MRTSGFISVEIMGGMIVFMIMLPVLYYLMESGLTEAQKKGVAQHLSAVSQAAQTYTRAHYDTLITQAGANAGPVLGVADLISDKQLPSGFGSTNAWGQGYAIYVRQPSAGTLQTIVLTTGGRSHSPAEPSYGNSIVPSTATLVSGAGGFVPTGAVPGQSSGMLLGAYGAYSMNLASLGISSPGAGHLGAWSSIDESTLAQDYLYRVTVPGHPELNQMQTDLNLTDHQIVGLHDVQLNNVSTSAMTCDEGKMYFNSGNGLYICRNGQLRVLSDAGNSEFFQHAQIASNGDWIGKPSCPAGSGGPQIFLAPAMASSDGNAYPLGAVQAYATDAGSSWQVWLRVLINQGSGPQWYSPNSTYGKLMVFTVCGQ